MAFASQACELARSCFACGGGGDDDDEAERIVNDRVPPVAGPSASAICADDTCPHRSEQDERMQLMQKQIEAVMQQNRRYERELGEVRVELAATNARCDKYQSQIVSLREQLRYREPTWEPVSEPTITPTYSPSYRTEQQEAPPPVGQQ